MDPNGNICENPPPFVDPKMAQAWKHYHLAVRAWERETSSSTALETKFTPVQSIDLRKARRQAVMKNHMQQLYSRTIELLLTPSGSINNSLVLIES
jgi:hypothetical protein